MLSTRVGVWVPIKVRVDDDTELKDRVVSAYRGTGDAHRTIRAIASRLNSSNTVVVVRDE